MRGNTNKNSKVIFMTIDFTDSGEINIFNINIKSNNLLMHMKH